MIVRDQKIERQAEFTRQHTLSQVQFKQLIEARIVRARQYYEADKKREVLKGAA